MRNGQKFNAILHPQATKYKIEDKIVIAFYIPVSDKKPIYFNSQSNTFIRRGSADQKATSEERDAMYRDQTFGTKTSELAKGTSRTDLDDKSIRQYRDYMSRFNPGISYNRYDEEELLSKMRVIDKTTGQCTYGGLLFFGKRDAIETHFPDFRIDLLEIPGSSYEDASSRYTFRLSEDDYQNLWECYFECFTRLKKNVDVEFKVSSEGFGEELSPGLLAMREALVNLLMHADYFSPASSRIRIFESNIEFYNPGGLPKPIEELKEKDLSIPRNPIISKLFRMVRLAENAGFGFDKIDSNWKEYNNSEPIYDISFDSTIVRLITGVVDEVNVENVGRNSGEVREKFGRNSEEIREKFGRSSEEIRKKFGRNLGKVLKKHSSLLLKNHILLLKKSQNILIRQLEQLKIILTNLKAPILSNERDPLRRVFGKLNNSLACGAKGSFICY